MKIKPYIFGGVGGNPLKTYYIRDGNAEIETFPGGRESIPLEGADIKKEKSAKTIVGLGTIKITSAGGSVQEWTNVPDVDKVFEALLRVSKGLPPEISESEKKDSKFKNIELEDFAVSLPVMPGGVFNVLSFRTYRGLTGKWQAEAEDWIEEGSELIGYRGINTLLSYRSINVVVPFSGKLVHRCLLDFGSWSEKNAWIDYEKFYHHTEKSLLEFIIQPVKGANINNAVFKAYKQIYDLVSDTLQRHEKYKKEVPRLDDEKFREEIWQDLELLKKSEAKKIPLSEIDSK